MSAIEVVEPTERKPSEREKQNIMGLTVGSKMLYLEWGTVVAAELTEVRSMGTMNLYDLRLVLRSGQDVILRCVLAEEAQTAINHVFNQTPADYKPGPEAESPEESAS